MATGIRYSEDDLWVKPAPKRAPLVSISRLVGLAVFAAAALLLAIGILAS
ncbi:MAG: hypothetical protein ABW042_01225 [Phenylobacterium sp.]